jgi:site-specific recombinase XerD
LTGRALDAVSRPSGKAVGPFIGISQAKFRQAWHESKAKTGFASEKQIVPHCLRHTCASRLVRGGIDIRRVQMWLGHQTLQMTMRYAHLATHDLDVCVSVLEQR